MEVGEAVLALDFINSQLDLAESTIFVLGEVTERDFDNTTLYVSGRQNGRDADPLLLATRYLSGAAFFESSIP